MTSRSRHYDPVGNQCAWNDRGIVAAVVCLIVACGGSSKQTGGAPPNKPGGSSGVGGAGTGGGSAQGGNGGAMGGRGSTGGTSDGVGGTAGEGTAGVGGEDGCLGAEACGPDLDCHPELGCVKVCSDPSGIIEVTSQAALEDLSRCEVIEGQLWIRGEDITDLRPLSALRLVTDELFFSECTELASLEELAKLEHVGSFGIFGSDAITDLRGLDALRSIGGGLQNNRLVIEDNASLVSISALAGVSMTVDDVQINSPVLANLDGLPQFTALRSLSISSAVTDLSIFSRLERCDTLGIMYNPSLMTIDLDVLTEVGSLGLLDNPSLTGIGLDALETGSLVVEANPLLDRIELPNLRTSSFLTFQSNAALLEIALPSLRTVSGQLLIIGNQHLTSLGNLDGLESIGQLEISWNSAFPQCFVDQLDARLQACGPRTCEGNNATATCE